MAGSAEVPRSAAPWAGGGDCCSNSPAWPGPWPISNPRLKPTGLPGISRIFGARTHKYLLLSGYLTFRLTGQFVDSIGSQVGYIPFDYKRLCWARSWNWKWRCLPVALNQLPRLVAPGKMLGVVSRQAALETGIPAGLPVVCRCRGQGLRGDRLRRPGPVGGMFELWNHSDHQRHPSALYRADPPAAGLSQRRSRPS